MKPFNLNEMYQKIESLPAPKPILSVDVERVRAMLLGVAIGDALGAPTEGMTPRERSAQHGVIESYFVGRKGIHATDDSQMAFLTLQSITEMGEVNPADIMVRFSLANLRGAGNTVPTAIERFAHCDTTWQTCGIDSLGNGALMRIAPVLVAHLNKGDTSRLWRDVAEVTILTHRNANAVAASIAYVDMLWGFLRDNEKVSPVSVLERFCEVVATVQDGEEIQPRSPRLANGALSSFCGMTLTAYESNVSVRDACGWWYSGAYLPETLPSMLYIIAKYMGDPRRAIKSAVNDTKDNDTVASLVGVAMGALHGRAAFRDEWINGLSGDLQDVGDRRMWSILEAATTGWAS